MILFGSFALLALISQNSTITVIAVGITPPVSTIRVGDGPYGIAFDPLNGNLYVANYESGTVSVISGANNSVVATVNLNIPNHRGK